VTFEGTSRDETRNTAGGRELERRAAGQWGARGDTTPAGGPGQSYALSPMREGCGTLPLSRLVGLAGIGAVWPVGAPVWASLADLLKEPQFNHLQLAPIAPALAATVASTYPVASASSGVVYVYNPALDTLERQTGVAGPIIGERAETIGKGVFNLGA